MAIAYVDTAAEVASPAILPTHRKVERWKAYDRRSLGDIRQLRQLSPEVIESVRLATLVFPFKVNEYVLENLIDWSQAPDDPMFRLVFPMAEMLTEADRAELRRAVKSNAPETLAASIGRIRAAMNPHSSDQLANVPIFDGRALEGVQHKYKETVLFFPKQGQTCHSYCSFCFRWPQFLDDGTAPKFESSDARALHSYLLAHPEVSDLLLTGGDPMVMNTRRLASYLEPLKRPEFAHIRAIRIGTKALTYWPHRFLDKADDVVTILRGLVDAGKHVAVMAHVNHWRELAPAPVEEAVHRLRSSGVVIRTQSPLLRRINDAAITWQKNWTEQVRLGLVPYYMLVERDTGASHYFSVPLARALRIYQDAVRGLSGLGRTARGPIMSTGPGKVHVVGTTTRDGQQCFVLNFHQARNPNWTNRLFYAEYSETAVWLTDLKPADGSSAFFFEPEYLAFIEAKHRAAAQRPAKRG